MGVIYTIKAEWNNLSGFYQPASIIVKYSAGLTSSCNNTISLTQSNDWTATLLNLEPSVCDLVFDNKEYYDSTISISGNATIITLTEKGFQADNKTNQLAINQSIDLIYKKGNYSNTYLIADITGLPDDATLFLTDDQNNQLYSPFDANGNYEKTICVAETTNTKIAIPLPAQYNGDFWTDYPVGTYNWKLRYYGDESYEAKDYPLTIQIIDFNIWEVQNPEIFPNEDISAKIKTYANTIPPITVLLTANATYNSNTGVITYPNNDIIDLSIGEHTQLINNKQLLEYSVKNPIEFYTDTSSVTYRIDNSSDNQHIGYKTLIGNINGNPYNIKCNGIPMSTVSHTDIGTTIRMENVILPPGTYMWELYGKTTSLSDGYQVTGQTEVTTEDCSISLSSLLDDEYEWDVLYNSGQWIGALVSEPDYISGTGHIKLDAPDDNYYNYISMNITDTINMPTLFSIYDSMQIDISNMYIDSGLSGDLEFFINGNEVTVVFDSISQTYSLYGYDIHNGSVLTVYFDDSKLYSDKIIIKQINKLGNNITSIPCVIQYRYQDLDPIANAKVALIDSSDEVVQTYTTDSEGNVSFNISNSGQYQPAALNIYNERILLGEIYAVKSHILYAPTFTIDNIEPILRMYSNSSSITNVQENGYAKINCCCLYGWDNSNLWECDYDVYWSPNQRYQWFATLCGIKNNIGYKLFGGWENPVADSNYDNYTQDSVGCWVSSQRFTNNLTYGTNYNSAPHAHINMKKIASDTIILTKTGDMGTNGTITMDYLDKLSEYERCSIGLTDNGIYGKIGYPYISNLIVKSL